MKNLKILVLALTLFSTRNILPTLDELINFIKTNNIDEIKKLVDINDCINQKDKDGMTPLMWAIINKHYGLAENLIRNYGADTYIKSNFGTTFLDLIEDKPKREEFEKLIQEFKILPVNLDILDTKGLALLNFELLGLDEKI